MTDSSYLASSNLSFKPRGILKNRGADGNESMRIEDQKYGSTERNARFEDLMSTRHATLNVNQTGGNDRESKVRVWGPTPYSEKPIRNTTIGTSHYRVADPIADPQGKKNMHNVKAEEPPLIREARKHHPEPLVEASIPYLVESEDRRANYIDYRHFESNDFEPGPYGITSEYLSKKLQNRNGPPFHDSQYLGKSGSSFYPNSTVKDDTKEHHMYPREKQTSAGQIKTDPLFGSSYEKFTILEDHLKHRREIPDIQSDHAYYGPSYVNYKHALARHPTMIEDVDFKTCYHKLYEDSGKLLLTSQFR